MRYAEEKAGKNRSGRTRALLGLAWALLALSGAAPGADPQESPDIAADEPDYEALQNGVAKKNVFFTDKDGDFIVKNRNYVFTVPANALVVSFAITNLNAAYQVYMDVNAPAGAYFPPSASSGAKTARARVAETRVVSFHAPAAGIYRISVADDGSPYESGEYSVLAYCQTTKELLSHNAAKTGDTIRGPRYYFCVVPTGVSQMSVVLTAATGGGEQYRVSAAFHDPSREVPATGPDGLPSSCTTLIHAAGRSTHLAPHDADSSPVTAGEGTIIVYPTLFSTDEYGSAVGEYSIEVYYHVTTPLVNNVAKTGSTVYRQSYYSFDIPANALAAGVGVGSSDFLAVEITSPSGVHLGSDSDRYGFTEKFDESTQTRRFDFYPAEAGRYLIEIRGAEVFKGQDFTITASYETDPAPTASHRDFNGDGKADIVWRRADSPGLAVWFMNGGGRVGTANPAAADALWRIVGVGDFDGDGKADILWRHATTHQPALWRMNGTARSASTILADPGPEWRVAAVADFDNDRRADILFQHRTGHQLVVWRMDGATRLGSGNIGANPGGLHRVVAAADFDADGGSDILFQNRDTRQLTVWLLDGGARTAGHVLSPVPAADWEAVDAADYHGDGGTAILFRNVNTHALAMWRYQNLVRTAAVSVAVPAPRVWEVQPAAD